MVAVTTVLVALTLSMLVTRVASTALTITGIPRHVARFQARSAFTGVGFTTGEAEQVVHHPVRRRIVMTLMLLGNIGVITIASSLILSFTRSPSTRQASLRFVLLVTGMVVLLWLANSRRFDRYLSGVIARVLAKWTDLSVRDYAELLQISGNYGISELQVQKGDWLAGATLAELGLRDEGAAVLGIYRPGRSYIGVPKGETRINAGDLVIVYGLAEVLAELDRRPAGAAGDRQHEESVARHSALLQEQRRLEEELQNQGSRPEPPAPEDQDG